MTKTIRLEQGDTQAIRNNISNPGLVFVFLGLKNCTGSWCKQRRRRFRGKDRIAFCMWVWRGTIASCGNFCMWK